MEKLFTASIMPNGIKSSPDGNDHVHFSLCIDINQDNPALDSSLPNYEANAKLFYRKFLLLSTFLTTEGGIPFKLKVTRGGITKIVKLQLSNDEFWTDNCNLGELANIRHNLWLDLFSVTPLDSQARVRGAMSIRNSLSQMEKALLANVPVQPNVTIGRIDSLNESNTYYNALVNSKLPNLNYTLIDKNGLNGYMSTQKQESKLFKTFGQSTDAAVKFQQAGKLNRVKFIGLHFNRLDRLEEADIVDLHRQATLFQVDNHIDLNELFITYSQISHHPIIMRLFGCVIDFSVPLKNVLDWGTEFDLSIDSFGANHYYEPADWRLPVTHIYKAEVQKSPLPRKLAYLVRPKSESLYKRSILDDKDAYLLNYDPMSQEQKLAGIRDKVAQGVTNVSGEFHDAFTRGIIYNHKKIAQLIAPAQVDAQKDDLWEDSAAMGQRVAMKTINKNDYWLSLTKRSTLIISRGQQLIYSCGGGESCIHFDHVGNYMDDQTAQIGHKTSEALFEFKGELLTLNTVFSRESKISKLEADTEELQNPPDQSVANSQLRLNKYLDIDYFPYDGKVRDGVSPNAVKLRYSLPEGDEKERELPSLRYGNAYQFLVYHQYKNGWGLPLNTDEYETQASLDEIWRFNRKKIAKPRNLTLKFRRLENTKPVKFYPQAKISNALEGDTGKIEDKDSLTDLVIRNTGVPVEAFRHVLPERISLEHAYWSGTLINAMDRDARFKWKCRYNFTPAKPGEPPAACEDGCPSDCGGTEMDDHYPGEFISYDQVRYIPDPLVDGFTIQLHWDKACSEQYLIGYGNNEAVFEKGPNSTVRSFGLSLRPLNDPNIENGQIVVSNHNLNAAIYFKPGMKAYAKLYNHTIDPENLEAWGHDYWINQLKEDSQKITIDDFGSKDTDPKSQALTISLTYATKKPLLPPEIYTFSSRDANFKEDDVIDLTYIDDWIKETVNRLIGGQHAQVQKRYAYLLAEDKKSPAFALDRNVIGLRPKDEKNLAASYPGSSKITFELVSRFERLDAINKNVFLPGTAPTGQLELLIRKEEFADDPGQYVFPEDVAARDRVVSHFPEYPVYSFSDLEHNQAYLDYKIDFSANILKQLKHKLSGTVYSNYQKYITDLKHDPFRDTVSQLAAVYDAKTTKYEVREYTLINTSKFKGYFNLNPVFDAKTSAKNGKAAGADTLENYQERSNPIKVMLLANDCPSKPLIAFIVTTIHEDRKVKGKETCSTQTGNRLTIYLHRGRLQSGRDERVAILLKNGSAYSKMFEESSLLSKAGRDVVSDLQSPASHFIEYENGKPQNQHITIPQPAENEYDARYEEKLSLVSFLPRFDAEKQLWKFEVEFNILTAEGFQLHNPFLNLAIVNYQPFAINYNKPGDIPDYALDCRLSEADISSFCYLLPRRHISAVFHKPNFFLDKWGSADVTVDFDQTSLNYFKSGKNKLVRSNFILCVEGSADGRIWSPLMSQYENDQWQLMHPLINFDAIKAGTNQVQKTIKFQRKSNPAYDTNPNSIEDHSHRFHKFRIRLVEVEWFKEERWEKLLERYKNDEKLSLLLTDVLSIEDLRVRFVELIY